MPSGPMPLVLLAGASHLAEWLPGLGGVDGKAIGLVARPDPATLWHPPGNASGRRPIRRQPFMTHAAACEALQDYCENSLNGAELAMRLRIDEAFSVVMPSVEQRNEVRANVRALCAYYRQSPPAWAMEMELV